MAPPLTGSNLCISRTKKFKYVPNFPAQDSFGYGSCPGNTKQNRTQKTSFSVGIASTNGSLTLTHTVFSEEYSLSINPASQPVNDFHTGEVLSATLLALGGAGGVCFGIYSEVGISDAFSSWTLGIPAPFTK